MNKSELSEKVGALIGELCDVDVSAVRGDARLTEYGFDSIRGMEFLVGLEEAFEIVIPDEMLRRLRTLDEVVSYLEGAIAT
jgi:acyl carrier protein